MIDKIKRQLAVTIRDYCRRVSLTQKDVAELSNTTQPRVSDLFALKIDRFSLDMLFKMAENLDLNVTITIGD